jgi:protein-S-isoprenylcysteine O-methyltransferase Ste14
MMVRIGNFLFHYRNALFPVVYLLLIFKSHPVLSDYRLACLLGFFVAFSGQFLRALTIGLEYIVRGGRNRQVYAEGLVQGGIFAHCRNPLYVGNLLILLGVGIAANSLLFLLIGLPFFAFAYSAIILAEENYLRNKFGEEFARYCSRVNRLIPRLSGLRQTVAGMEFNWGRLVTSEYGSTYIWLAAIVLSVLKNLWLSGEYKANAPAVLALWGSMIFVTVCYGIARYLKKSGLLKDRVPLSSKAAS